ncbi:MAG: DUF2254 domain-containing protein [Micrococcales bacterium]|nr:DUF2254 domain-containing protein [Micrococcales bacterium]
MTIGQRARAAWESLHDRVRSRLWPVPVAALALAIVAGLTLPYADAAFSGSLPSWLDPVIFGGDADAARSVLGAVASSLITVTSLTFSLTVVTLQLAASQFSPRLLRTFAGDLFVQATLGLFLGTFIYSLTVLRTVRGGDGTTESVPRLAVTTSFLLAIASTILLVAFLAHLVQQIRVETLLRTVHKGATDTIGSTLGPVTGEPRSGDTDDTEARTTEARPTEACPTESRPTESPRLPPVPDTAIPLLADDSGFLVRVDRQELLEVCVDLDVSCVIEKVMGSSLVKGCPIGWVWAVAGPMATEQSEQAQRRLARSIHTGFERTSVQDVGHGLRQVTDVANKALSPGINDPTTAMHALGHLSALLCEIATREVGPVLLRDDDGRVRVGLTQPDLADLVEVAITQPRRYGAPDPQVMQRLYQLLAELAWHCRPDQLDVVSNQLERLDATVQGQDYDSDELARFERAAATVRWSMTHPTSPRAAISR